jgi:tRNA pseudouridine38-40 synthase
MKRYFIEVSYHGHSYSGFQVQENAPTVQAELEKVLRILIKGVVTLTGSSRTDAGVHARQNYFHFDTDYIITGRQLYNINALLPQDITVISITEMPPGSHCRFDAISRLYTYQLHQRKDSFLVDRSYFYPYTLQLASLQEAALSIQGIHDFKNFSKRNTQVKTFVCNITESAWAQNDYMWSYTVRGNRFLRGMVRGLVGTMLKVGTGKLNIEAFNESIKGSENSVVDFAVPGKGLFLEKVEFPAGYFDNGFRL